MSRSVRVVLFQSARLRDHLHDFPRLTLGSVSHGSPPCVRYASHLFFDPIFLNSSSMYFVTNSVVFLMPRLGTSRIENLPLTEHGMTVLDPGAAVASAMTWRITAMVTYRRHPRYRAVTSLGFLGLISKSNTPSGMHGRTHSSHQGLDGITG